ncbi:MAG: NADH:ubiquinone reductase (Na(+)-transporting) subunit D [Clostridiaceae bacterium]|nr:NADH:ubiquinone reductase (Na(+)-transporting) subunit D [Clostridiaceae bacterium]
MPVEKTSSLIKRSVFIENQVLRQILGVCSTLAVTNAMTNSLVMGLGVTFATMLSSFTLSLMRNYIPHRIRMIVQTLVIASYVILVDIVIRAYLPGVSKQLGPYVGLIITNCIVMGRAEAYAQKNPPLPSLLDGLFSGLGYMMILLMVSFIRELLGFGTLFGIRILPDSFEKWTIMVMPPAAFFIIGSMIWFLNARKLKREAAKEDTRK